MSTVLVVGGSGGIGSVIARSVHAKGHDVVVADLARPKRLPAYVRKWMKVDLRVPKSVDDVAAELRGSVAHLWGLVYAAGVYPIAPLSAYDSVRWREVLAVNVEGAFRLARALIPVLREHGRIVFVASAAGHLGSRDVGYSVSKAGLLGLMRSLAKNLAAETILVNAVCPGIIDTAMSRRMGALARRRAVNTSLLRRAGTAQEVAVAVDFLLEPRNTYMTGSCIAIDGGATHL